jgi:hypothetical protein
MNLLNPLPAVSFFSDCKELQRGKEGGVAHLVWISSRFERAPLCDPYWGPTVTEKLGLPKRDAASKDPAATPAKAGENSADSSPKNTRFPVCMRLSFPGFVLTSAWTIRCAYATIGPSFDLLQFWHVKASSNDLKTSANGFIPACRSSPPLPKFFCHYRRCSFPAR